MTGESGLEQFSEPAGVEYSPGTDSRSPESDLLEYTRIMPWPPIIDRIAYARSYVRGVRALTSELISLGTTHMDSSWTRVSWRVVRRVRVRATRARTRVILESRFKSPITGGNSKGGMVFLNGFWVHDIIDYHHLQWNPSTCQYLANPSSIPFICSLKPNQGWSGWN